MNRYDLQMQLLRLEEQGYNMLLLCRKYNQPIQNNPGFSSWYYSVTQYVESNLRDHPLYQEISSMYSSSIPYVDINALVDRLHIVGQDKAYWEGMTPANGAVPPVYNTPVNTMSFMSINSMGNTSSGKSSQQFTIKDGADVNMEKNEKPKVFVVHGHDEAAKEKMARTLEQLGFKPIILHEQPDAGRTIIEKIEHFSDVVYAVVLYTECDIGRDKNEPRDKERYRARQNVVFEHGYLVAKLTRERVCAFVKGDVEIPGDYSGVIYTAMDAPGAWKQSLVKNMKAVGLKADLNKLL